MKGQRLAEGQSARKWEYTGLNLVPTKRRGLVPSTGPRLGITKAAKPQP